MAGKITIIGGLIRIYGLKGCHAPPHRLWKYRVRSGLADMSLAAEYVDREVL
jgi:hypothetical protein